MTICQINCYSYRFFSCNNRRIHACWLWQKVIYLVYWHWILLLKLLRFITFVSPFGVPSNVVVDMFKNVCSVFGRRFYFWWMVVVFCCCKFFWMEIERDIYKNLKKKYSFQYFGRIIFWWCTSMYFICQIF